MQPSVYLSRGLLQLIALMLYMMHANIIAQYFDGKILSNLACLEEKKEYGKVKRRLEKKLIVDYIVIRT